MMLTVTCNYLTSPNCFFLTWGYPNYLTAHMTATCNVISSPIHQITCSVDTTQETPHRENDIYACYYVCTLRSLADYDRCFCASRYGCAKTMRLWVIQVTWRITHSSNLSELLLMPSHLICWHDLISQELSIME